MLPPLRRLPSPPAQAPAEAEILVLHTSLLGDLRVPGSLEQAAELQALSARAAVYATRVRGEGTRRAYRAAWSAYETWCASLGREPFAGDPETLALYAGRSADRSLAVFSLRVHFTAVQAAHRLAGVAHDLRHSRLVMVLEGSARDKGTRPRGKAAAAGPNVLRLMLATRPSPATRSVPVTERCCCSASARRFGAANWPASCWATAPQR